MRYGDGGGADQAERARRERVRQRAAQLFADGRSAVEVAGLLEVSTKSAYAWRARYGRRRPSVARKGNPTVARLLLVRHGQASFGAGDYDALSRAGHEQARVL